MSFIKTIDDRIDRYCTYKLKKVMTSCGLFECPVGDNRVNTILRFKGTGEKRKFVDVLLEYTERNFKRIEIIREGRKPEGRSYWLDEYIIQNNFQIIFEPDDIVLRHKHKAR